MDTIRYLRTVARKELQNEHYRIELANDEQFEPYQLYCTLSDQNGLNAKQIEQILKFNSVQSTYICQLFGSKGFISFQQLVLPQSDSDLKEQVKNRYSSRQEFDVNVADSVIQCLISLINSILQAGVENKIALDQSGIDVESAFRELDKSDAGFLRFEDFEMLSREINSFMPPEEIIALFRLADIDQDSRLTFNEFKLLFVQRQTVEHSKDFLYANILDQDDSYVQTNKKVPQQNLVKPKYQQYQGTTEKKLYDHQQDMIIPQAQISEWDQDTQQMREDEDNQYGVQEENYSPLGQSHYQDQSEAPHLTDLFKEQIIMEKQLSDVKNTVVMELDYTVPNLWAFFTRNQSQYITKLIFSQKLADLGINFIEEDFDSLIRQYDSTGQGLSLNQDDLTRMMMPISADFNLLLNMRKQCRLSKHTLSLLRELIETHFWVQNVKRTLIQNYVNRHDFNMEKAFRLIYDTAIGMVSPKSLQGFLWKQGIFVGHADALQVLSIYDIDKDGLIGIEEFQQTLESAFQ